MAPFLAGSRRNKADEILSHSIRKSYIPLSQAGEWVPTGNRGSCRAFLKTGYKPPKDSPDSAALQLEK
jgi:hypothetical protein